MGSAVSEIFRYKHIQTFCYFFIMIIINMQDAQLVHTGTALMVASSVVCVVAAVTNDRYFPEARMSQKEAKAFFDHLKSTRPRQTIILKNK